MARKKKPTPFGKVVRKRLVDLDMNQSDLAKALGISAVHVHYIIYGERNVERWTAPICEALGIKQATRTSEGV